MTITSTSNSFRSGPFNIRSHFFKIYGRLQDFRLRRRQIAELRSVDPRILKDLAIDRSEITSFVQTGGSGRRRKYES